MTVPDAYPVGYRLGIDMLFWVVNLGVSFLIIIYFLIQTFQTKFINKKKLYLGSFFMAMSIFFTHLLFQMAYIFPNVYNIFVASGYIPTYLGLTIFIYYWENNIIKMKFIPTFLSSVLTGIIFINFLFNLIFQHQLIEWMSIFVPLGGIIVYLALIFVLFRFSQRVIGRLRYLGYIVIFSIISYAIGYTFDTYFIFEILPNFSPIISPIVVLISTLVFFYGIYAISDGILFYYQKTHVCVVHRGKILQGDQIYLCPNCSAIYCKNCYDQIIKDEGCWNCFEIFKMDKEIKPKEDINTAQLKKKKAEN